MTDDVQRVIATAVDGDFYRTAYGDITPEVGVLRHYRTLGWREGRDPAPWFSVADYLAENPDVAAAGVEPLSHFLTQGRHEGRDVRPSRHATEYFAKVGWEPRPWSYEPLAPEPAEEAPAISRDDQRAAIAPEFDPAFYLASYPDVAAAGWDPLEHFLSRGWAEGRDPHPDFSVDYYMEAYPDIAGTGINPYAHYLIHGRNEGRRAKHDLGFRYDVIQRLIPVRNRIVGAVSASRAMRTLPADVLARRLGGLRDLHISFSQDDFTEHYGGLQLCVRREADRFAVLGADHVHLHPATGWQTVRAADEPGPLAVMLNGRRLGAYAPGAVSDALAQVVEPGGRRSLAIHSLLGHGALDTVAIARAAGLEHGYFWLHDFASLCAGFHLLRDDVEDCAAPPPESAACEVCAYGRYRGRHLQAHRELFEGLPLTVVAPAQTTLDFWRGHCDLPYRDAVVLPHAELIPQRSVPKRSADRPFRVVFPGMPVPLKGWPLFRELAERLSGDPRYEFLHLGGRPDPGASMRFQQVMVSGQRPSAMQEEIAASRADAALIWPLCRETFSFTAYEAAAAGAAVITGPDSGNVAAFVAASGVGRVLPDEAALVRAFTSGEILSLGRRHRRATLHGLAFSGLTADLVAERQA